MNKETVRTEGSVIVLHFSKSFIYNEPPLKQHDRLCKKITFKHEGQSEGLQLHHIQESQTPPERSERSRMAAYSVFTLSLNSTPRMCSNH